MLIQILLLVLTNNKIVPFNGVTCWSNQFKILRCILQHCDIVPKLHVSRDMI